MSSPVPGLAPGLLQADPGLQALYHRLHNQLGMILAHAELLEARAGADVHRASAAQIVAGTLHAMATAREIRQRVDGTAG